MKKMALTASMLLAAACTCFCQQDNEYVEVSIHDTIHLVPDEINFIVMLRADESAAYYAATGTQKKIAATPPDKRGEKLRAIIAEQKIDTLPADEYLTLKEARMDGIKEKIILHFTAAAQLTRFIKEAGNIQDVTGFIVSKKSDQEPRYRKMLTQKLIEKAHEEASFLAIQSKKTLGKIVQVKDENIKDNGGEAGWTSYPPLSALAGYYGSSYDTSITLLRAIRVRYLWQ